MSKNVLEQTMEYAQAQLSDQPKTKEKQRKKHSETADKKEKRKQKKQQKAEKKRNKIPRKRLFPIPLRVLTVLLLAGVALIAGLMVGYGFLGGEDPREVLEIETWKHMIDFVIKEK